MQEIDIRPLKKSEEGEFAELTTHHIGLWYDDIEESFANIILDAHNLGFDPLGYFTKNKTIWVAEINHHMAGFLVATEKRGGSVKLAPGIIKPEYQGKGIIKKLWKELEEIYLERGARKIYNHAPLSRLELLRLVVGLGCSFEAHLHEHYRKGQDDYVVGKIIKKSIFSSIEPLRWSNSRIIYKIRDYYETDNNQLENLILTKMPIWYEEIDDNFFKSILSAEKRFTDTFKKKGKKIFVVESNNELVGCCVTTPKRGGAVKLVPFLFYPDKANYKMARDLVLKIQSFFYDQSYRKLYAPIPIFDIDTCAIFRMAGFEIEGLLKEPYKANIDNFFWGKLIR